MKPVFKITLVFFVVLLGSCDWLAEDACYDHGKLWDPVNNMCMDDCIRSGGIFEIANKRCEIPSTNDQKIGAKELFKSVQSACFETKKIMENEFNVRGASALNNVHALQFDYPRLAPISYTTKYGFGQDGVCNFVQQNNHRIKVIIRKNARVKSKYSVNEFNILKIEQNQTDIETPIVLWERG